MRIAIINKYRNLFLLLSLIIVILVFVFSLRSLNSTINAFSAEQAYDYVKYQMDLGPRTMGSIAHEKTADWIVSTLKKNHWQVEIQEAVISGQSIKNIIGRRGSGTPWVILGSHYDSRATSDRDLNLNNRSQATPGADDGASTVGILLELSRVIPANLDKQIWLVFFDAEDNGVSSGVGWDIGADYFVSVLQGKPDSVVILDMLGDKDLNIYMEENSNRDINTEIWSVAEELGYTQFIPAYKHAIIDDHIPFIKAGMRAVDVIDIEYPYWHTTQDTLDKISPESLKIVGDTIIKWLQQYPK